MEGVESPPLVVVKLKIHSASEGYSPKIKKHIEKFKGVLRVTVFQESNTATVLGNLDLDMLREHVIRKFHEVEIVASVDLSKEPAAIAAVTDELYELQGGDPTVVLKTSLDCDEVIRKLRKTFKEMNEVKAIYVDCEKELVTVQGRVNANTLQLHLEKMINRKVVVVSNNGNSSCHLEMSDKGSSDR